MLPIIICEDSNMQRKKIENLVELFINRKNVDLKIELSSGDPLYILKYLDKNNHYPGIYLLDVNLNTNMNGIKLASKIREKDPLGYIIFITTHSELSFLTFRYKVAALDYILKDDFEDLEKRLEQCLTLCMDRYYNHILKEDVLNANYEDKVINIALKDILFIETSSNPHKIIIHECSRQTEIYGSLKEVSESLNSDFYRCHRSYLVNTTKIDSIDKKERTIKLVNGQDCLVSFRYMAGLLKCL